MTRWWEDPVNQPKEPPTLPAPEERESMLRETLEQLEKEGLSANRGTGAWRAGLRRHWTKHMGRIEGHEGTSTKLLGVDGEG